MSPQLAKEVEKRGNECVTSVEEELDKHYGRKFGTKVTLKTCVTKLRYHHCDYNLRRNAEQCFRAKVYKILPWQQNQYKANFQYYQTQKEFRARLLKLIEEQRYSKGFAKKYKRFETEDCKLDCIES